MRRLLNRSFWLKRFFLIGIVAPFALLWGEMFTRILLPQNLDPRMDIYASDPIVGFKFRPNAKSYEKGKEYNAPHQIKWHPFLTIRPRKSAS
ncbi:MAG: hypothetical protein L7F78_14675, partial [Syntrophales bacterium LBB04]|nr:hypothetical protein [Syntrophales bacterium LBB04]